MPINFIVVSTYCCVMLVAVSVRIGALGCKVPLGWTLGERLRDRMALRNAQCPCGWSTKCWIPRKKPSKGSRATRQCASGVESSIICVWEDIQAFSWDLCLAFFVSQSRGWLRFVWHPREPHRGIAKLGASFSWFRSHGVDPRREITFARGFVVARVGRVSPASRLCQTTLGLMTLDWGGCCGRVKSSG